MSKAAPIVLSFVVVFSVLGYIAMDSSSNESNEDYFICDNGEKISSNLQNNGFEDCSDSSDEDVIDHSKHLHADPVLEAILVEIEGEQFVTGNVIHDHPMEVRINWVMQSADGISSGDNLATDMNGAWTFNIDVMFLDTLEVNQAIESLNHRARMNEFGQNYTTVNDIVDTFVGYCHGVGNDSKELAQRKARAYMNICNL